MEVILHGLSYVVPYLVLLGVLVSVHEFGHYWVARRCGVRIETFSIGFGPEAFGWYDKAGTRWRFSWVPLGGYVKMYGDADPSSRPGEAVFQMSAEERAVSHFHRPVAARAAIAAAGPFANFLFAILIYTGLFATVGEPFTPPDVGKVVPGSAAAAAGIQPGDVFVAIDGHSIARFEDIVENIELNTGTPVMIEVRRHGQLVDVTATPRMTSMTDQFHNVEHYGVLGIERNGVASVRQSLPVAFWEATKETGNAITGNLRAVWQIISGERGTDQLGGPVKILTLSGQVAQTDIWALIPLAATLSISLGLINLFPIPILDGGHLLFYAAEALRGRPLGPRAQEIGFGLGLAIVLTLMVFVTWNDLAQEHVFKYLRGLVT